MSLNTSRALIGQSREGVSASSGFCMNVGRSGRKSSPASSSSSSIETMFRAAHSRHGTCWSNTTARALTSIPSWATITWQKRPGISMSVPLSVSPRLFGMVPTITHISPYFAGQKSAMRCSTLRHTPWLSAGVCGAMFDMRNVCLCSLSPQRVFMAKFGAIWPRSQPECSQSDGEGEENTFLSLLKLSLCSLRAKSPRRDALQQIFSFCYGINVKMYILS